jgi:LmbE family N-acetylglucosaminyl deacetylase
MLIDAAPAQAAPMPNSWLRRLRRKLRGWTVSQNPAADGWTPARGSVLVVAPHPDDEVIGCGGTICRHVAADDPVTVVYLTRGEKSRGYPWLTETQRQETRVKEAMMSCAVLGVADTVFLDGEDGNLADPTILNELAVKVAAAVTEKQPKVVYVPHAGDNHPDHIAAFRIISQIARGMSVPPTVYQYELWSPLIADFAVDITKAMPAKVKAVKCHQSALDAFDYVSTMMGLAAYRSGTMLQRKGYAEAFRRTPDLHRS